MASAKGKAAFGETLELSAEELSLMKSEIMSVVAAGDPDELAAKQPGRRFRLFKYVSIAASVLAAAMLAVGWAYLVKTGKQEKEQNRGSQFQHEPLPFEIEPFDRYLSEVILPDTNPGIIGAEKTDIEKALYKKRMVRTFSIEVEGYADPIEYVWYGGPRILVRWKTEKQRELEESFIKKYRADGPLSEMAGSD